MEDLVSLADPLPSSLGTPSAGAPEPTSHLPAMADPGRHVAPEDPRTSAVGLACWEGDGGWVEVHRLHSLHYGDEVSAHWAAAQQDVLEEGGGIHTADQVAPMLCGEVEEEGDEEEEVSAAPFAGLVALAVRDQASLLLAWAHC